jgi:hypothetical protein
LPRNAKLLFDTRNLGFETYPSWWIGYIPHKETRLQRGEIKQQDGAMDFFSGHR